MSVAAIYARAFYETVKGRNGSVEPVETQLIQLSEMSQLLQESAELRVVLTSPMISPNEKVRIAEQIIDRAGWTPLVRNFVYLLIRKGRLSQLSEICLALDEVRTTAEGGVVGKLESADKVTDSDVEELSRAFSKKLNRKVSFKVSVDSNLLAGIRVTVNGVTYDGTLRSQLERLKERFIQ